MLYLNILSQAEVKKDRQKKNSVCENWAQYSDTRQKLGGNWAQYSDTQPKLLDVETGPSIPTHDQNS